MFLSKLISCSGIKEFQSEFNEFMNFPCIVPIDYQFGTSDKSFHVEHFLIPPSQWGTYSNTVYSVLVNYRIATLEELNNRLKDLLRKEFKARDIYSVEYDYAYNGYWYRVEGLNEYSIKRVQYLLIHRLNLCTRMVEGNLEYLTYRNTWNGE